VTELRGPRNRAIDTYLKAGNSPSTEALKDMQDARGEFGRWHFYSLALNFVTLLLVTGAMGMAGHLPAAKVPTSREAIGS